MSPTLLCVLEHPTQYDPAVWASLHARGRLSPLVWYARRGAPADAEVARQVEWRQDRGLETVVPDQAIAARLSSLEPRPAAVLLSGWTRPRTWRAAAAAWRRGIPVILPTDKTLNEPSPRMPVRLASAMFHAAKAKLFDGFLTTGVLGSQYLASIGVPPWRIARGLYPVDGPWWRRRLVELAGRSAELRAGLPEGPVILGVAKHSLREGPLDLLEGFARYWSGGGRGSLLLVGDGPLRPRVEERVRSLGLERRVQLAGYVPYLELAAYYGAADVFVHVPSREPWGISVGEAMSCGLPVVASTAVGAAADLVIHGRTGALVNPGDVPGLGQALRQACDLASKPGQRDRQLHHAASMEAEAAAAMLEDLVTRLGRRGPRDFMPTLAHARAELRNVWGRWSE